MESTAAITLSRLVMPILVTLVGASGSVLLWMLWHSIEEVKLNQAIGIKQMWVSVGKISDSQKTDENIIQRQVDISEQLNKLTQDHETRIRLLERVPH
jgi:hypothetical protein